MLPVAILVGGLATRLRPITETIPKSLVTVAGRPFIFHQLAYLHGQGAREVLLCTGHLGNRIESIIGNGAQFGLKISYSADGSVPLGTGGALKKAVPMLPDEFFVLYGDSFLPINLAQIEAAFFASHKPALMTLLKNDDRWDKSNVSFSGGSLIEYNKKNPSRDMAFIDYGLGVLSRHLFEQYAEGQSFDLADLYHELSLKGALAGCEVHERFYEIGSHEGLRQTELYFSGKA